DLVAKRDKPFKIGAYYNIDTSASGVGKISAYLKLDRITQLVCPVVSAMNYIIMIKFWEKIYACLSKVINSCVTRMSGFGHARSRSCPGTECRRSRWFRERRRR